MKYINSKKIVAFAKKIIEVEANQLYLQRQHIDENFTKAVDVLLRLEGKVIVVGVGKSGLIGRKIASTFSSLQIPSIFLHPVELLHGDLGLISPKDVMIILSYSGETEEIKKLILIVKELDIKIIAFTGKKKSKLAKLADIIINTKVDKEACPHNIVPTSSTTAMLGLGDALGITVANIKGFKKEDFAKIHPAGSLGKLLNLRVKDIMRTGEAIPKVFPETKVKDALLTMTSKKLGATTVINKNGILVGYFTDGDLRRFFQKGINILNYEIKKVMSKTPKFVYQEELVIEAKQKMRRYNCDNLAVVDNKNRVIGIIDERDILQEGL